MISTISTSLIRRALALLAVVMIAAPPPAPAADEAARLRALFDKEWQWRLRESPLFATNVGVHVYNDKLPSVSLADEARRAEDARGFLRELDAIDRARLDRAAQVNYDIFRRQLEDGLKSFEFGDYQMPLNADSGFHSSFARLGEEVPLATARDYENYIARLRAFPRYTDGFIELMREGLRRGMTPPQVTLTGVETSIEPLAKGNAEKHPLYAPFRDFPQTLPESERTRLAAAGRQAIAEAVLPAYRKFLEFMTKEYVPGARATLAATQLPNGKAYYDWLVSSYTTLPMTAEEVHQIGRREVASLRAEMEAVIRKTGFQGDFAAFLNFLRTDPRFYAKTSEELLKQASFIAKRMDGKLPALFKTLPRTPYTVEPVPDHLAPKYTAGRYVSPPWGGTQPGIYWVNTYKLETRPLYNLEALTLHEAVPGHHLQGSLSQEQEGLPNFRRFSYISAFGEGWGLYSEWLGLEAGFYTDPYSDFGRLTYAMWRACRLVVDTGVHAKGWTREQVMDYLASNTALPLHEVETETDRYISWPGQALSYRIGYLKIRELRGRAEKELGERFDVREFHDRVLVNGSVPLPVLEDEITAWIAEKKSAAAG